MRVTSPHSGRIWLVFCLFCGLLAIGPGAFAQDKVIRLRNETISTPPKSPVALQTQAAEAPATGLFLVQFNDPVQSAWRDQLRRQERNEPFLRLPNPHLRPKPKRPKPRRPAFFWFNSMTLSSPPGAINYVS